MEYEQTKQFNVNRERKHPYIIALMAGGYSGEYSVSLRSAEGILSWLDRDIFEPYLVIVRQDGWFVQMQDGREITVDKNYFGYETGGERIKFDYAYITIHGTPGEDGLLQGYLDMMQVPYNTSGVLTEALTFNKYYCNRYLSSWEGIRTARSLRLLRGDAIPLAESIVSMLGLPLFVKPNTGGSSVATSRVEAASELEGAIALAFGESGEILMESFISGVEVTCGCYMSRGVITALPITEVVSKNKFFDFDAKYNGQVEEITPARIPQEQWDQIQSLTKTIYQAIDAKGIIRVDYIIEADGLPTLLEVNTTPGMTPTSFIPQQIAASGRDMTSVLTEVIESNIGS